MIFTITTEGAPLDPYKAPAQMKCEKCGATSGDDWSQCKGSCPLPGSPHYIGETFTQPKITGYRQLNQAETDLMNKIKAKGIEIEALFAEVVAHCAAQSRAAIEAQDMVEIRRLDCAQAYRWTAIAKTDFQTALMALTRAVAQPSSF